MSVSDNLLLGLDFLLSAGAVLNLLKNIMTIGAEKIPITLTYDKNQGVQLALSAKQVYIEPGGEANLSIEKISNKNELQLFEPAVHITELNVANTIVKLNEPTGFSITNTSKSGIKIKSGTVLGTFSDINIRRGNHFHILEMCQLTTLSSYLNMYTIYLNEVKWVYQN